MLDKTNSILDDIAQVIGYTATCALVDLLGHNKRNLFVPLHVTEDHYLAKIIGMPAFRALVKQYGGQLLNIPEGRWRDVDRLSRKVVMMYLAGKKTQEICERTGLKPRRVRYIYVQLEKEGLIPIVGEAREVLMEAIHINDEIPTENAS